MISILKSFFTVALVLSIGSSCFASESDNPSFNPNGLGEFKARLFYTQEFTYGDGGNNINAENFVPASRIRFGFEYNLQENLYSYVHFYSTPYEWGSRTGDDFTKDPDAKLRVRYLVMDWAIPKTNYRVRFGRLPLVAPSYAFGSAILDGRGDAVNIGGYYNDNININLSWIRLVSNEDENIPTKYNNADAFMLSSLLSFENLDIAPWVMYINKEENIEKNTANGLHSPLPVFGKNEPYSADGFIFSNSLKYNALSDFTFKLDTLYTTVHYNDPKASQRDVTSYLIAGKAEYAISNGSITLGAWYTPGDDYDKTTGMSKQNKDGIVLDGEFAATNMLFGDTILGFDKYNDLRESVFGTMGAVLGYENFSIIEKVRHTARVAYITGTNDSPNWENNSRPTDKTNVYAPNFNYLVQGDNFIELNFNTKYKVYNNLLLALELSHLFVDYKGIASNADSNDDIFRSSLVMLYFF